MIGVPAHDSDSYAGLLDMGDHYLVQTTDSTGTKIDLAFAVGNVKTIGSDLLAMVADDAVCVGAEVIAVSNCLDVPKVEPDVVDALLSGLAEACMRERIVIPAGEIAEVPGAVTRAVWSATAIGIVAKENVIDTGRIAAGDAIIALREHGARSNGFSLIRKILAEKFGQDWHREKIARALLTPSSVYHRAVLGLIGGYGEKREVDVRGIAHITGGGIPSKLRRILRRSGLGAHLHSLWPAPPSLLDIMSFGNVTTEEAYRTWNMGNGMLLVVAQPDVSGALSTFENTAIEAKIAGEIRAKPDIMIEHMGKSLHF